MSFVRSTKLAFETAFWCYSLRQQNEGLYVISLWMACRVPACPLSLRLLGLHCVGLLVWTLGIRALPCAADLPLFPVLTRTFDCGRERCSDEGCATRWRSCPYGLRRLHARELHLRPCDSRQSV